MRKALVAPMDSDLRDRIIAEPEAILDDLDVMRALVAASERSMGANIVDLRGIAMDRLEARLDRLEDTHRSVIAAAYENLAGTNQVHRAVLALLAPLDFESFLKALATEVAPILRVEVIRLVLETARDPAAETPSLKRLGEVLCVAEPGFVSRYASAGRNMPVRAVTLRQAAPQSDAIYGEAASWVRSEAVLRLDLGPGRLPGMLVLGSEDPHHFRPAQGTDLLAFLAGVFERAMWRWLEE